MQDEKPKLTIKQEAGILALIAHGDIKRAAKAAGVNECTFHRWLKDAGFSQAVREARQTVWNNTLETLKTASSDAIQTLKKNLKAKRVTDQNTAAKSILEFSFRAVQMLELEERIAAIELALASQKGKK